MDSGGYPGCSRHLGEFIQSHCATCNQILCLKCLTTGHCGHDVKIYDDFLRDRREEVEAQVQRLKIIRQRVENQKAIFSKLSADLENFYEKTESKLESYMVVQDAMKEWKKNLTDELERKKSQQLQNLDMAVCNPDSKSFKIKIPKMFVDKRAELVSDVQMKVRELTPASIHFLTGKTLHRRYSHRLHRNCISLYENIEPNDIYDDILTKGQLEGYKEKDMSTQSNKQQQTTGYINVDEMCKKNELPPSLPPRPSCNRGHTGQFKQPCPLPIEVNFHVSQKIWQWICTFLQMLSLKVSLQMMVCTESNNVLILQYQTSNFQKSRGLTISMIHQTCKNHHHYNVRQVPYIQVL